MPFRIKGKLDGIKEAAAKLDGIKRGLRNKVLRKAITAAARVLAKAVKAAQTNRRSGTLKKSIGSVVRTYKTAVVGVVGPRTGFASEWHGKKIDPVFYAHLAEGGAKPHALGKGSRLKDQYSFDRKTKKRSLAAAANQHGGKHPGAAGTHFMERGLAAGRAEAEAKAVQLIAEGVEQLAKAA